jgi:small nuclear ribonucleoprotein (snRNP)-like protein
VSEEEGARTAEEHEQPLDVLSGMADKEVLIRLVDKTELIGRLIDFDQYMNLKMEVDGEELLIRGNNVILIGTDWQDARRAEAGSSP